MTIASERGRDVWVYEPGRGISTQVTTDGVTASTLWSPNGRHVIAWRQSADRYTIVALRADGAGTPIVFLESNHVVVPSSFSPRGERLLYFDINPQTKQDLWTLPIDWSDPDRPTAGKPEPFVRTASAEFEPAFSHDGRWVAYRSGEPGVSSPIFVSPYPGPGDRTQGSSGIGNERNPMWSPDGKQLFYESDDNHLMVIDYTVADSSFVATKPRVWADYRTFAAQARYTVSLAPDGKRFVVITPFETPDDEPVAGHVTFLLNFFDQLRRRVPK